VIGAETLDLLHFHVGVVRIGHGGARDPPLGAWQSCGQIGSSSWRSMSLGATGLRDDFAVRGLPKPDKSGLFADDYGVIPPPYHGLSAVRRGRDRYEVPGGDPLRPRRRECLGVLHVRALSGPEDLTRILLNMQDDAAPQQRASRTSIG
jgi:hypothetical protein